MVGELGEVLVMDWGLARSLDQDGRHWRERPLGTPVYMAPEHASRAPTALTARSDVYLLGAVLFRVLAGRPPHRIGDDIGDVLAHAGRGHLLPLPEGVPDELRALCLRALAPRPEDRFPDVLSFQQALRAYLGHRESLRLAEAAAQTLADAREGASGAPVARVYEGFSEAVAGFRQARSLWEENPRARAGEREARRAFAEAALARGDTGLAENQAAQLAPADDALTEAIAAQRAQRRRERRVRRLLLGALVGCLLALVGGLYAWARHAEEQRAEIDRQFAFQQLHGEIAVDALRTLTDEVTVLVDQLGDASSQRAADRVLRAALAGWQRLEEADVPQRDVSLYGLTARLKAGELRLTVAGAAGAIEDAEEVVAAYRDAVAAYPSDTAFVVGYANALGGYASMLRELGRPRQSAAVLDTALVLLEDGAALRVLGHRNGVLVYQALLGQRAEAAIDAGDLERGIALIQRALSLDEPWQSRARGLLLSSLAQALRERGDFERSHVLFRDAIALFEAVAARDPDHERARRDLAIVRGQYGALLSIDDLEASQRELGAALEVLREAVGQNPHRENRELYAAMLANYAGVSRSRERFAMFDEAIGIFEELLAASPDEHDLRANLHGAYNRLAHLVDDARSDALLCAAIALWDHKEPQSTRAARLLGESLHELASLRGLGRRLGEAARLTRRAVEVLGPVWEREPDDRELALCFASALAVRLYTLHLLDQAEEARALLPILDRVEASFPPADPARDAIAIRSIVTVARARLDARPLDGEQLRALRLELEAADARFPGHAALLHELVRVSEQESMWLATVPRDFPAATEVARRAVAAARRFALVDDDHYGQRVLVGTLFSLARGLDETGAREESIAVNREALALIERLKELDGDQEWLLHEAFTCHELARHALAERDPVQAIAMIERTLSAVAPIEEQMRLDDLVGLLFSLHDLAVHAEALGLAAEAARRCWEAVARAAGAGRELRLMALARYSTWMPLDDPATRAACERGLADCAAWLGSAPGPDARGEQIRMQIALCYGELLLPAGEPAAAEQALALAAACAAQIADPSVPSTLRGARDVNLRCARMLRAHGREEAAAGHLEAAREALRALPERRDRDEQSLRHIEELLEGLR